MGQEAYVLRPEVFHLPGLVNVTAWIFLVYMAANLLLEQHVEKLQMWPPRRVAYYVFGASALCLVFMPAFKSPRGLLNENTYKRIHSNDAGFNERLSKLFEQEAEAQLITCYQVIYNIPALQGRLHASGASGIELVNHWLSDPKIGYYLHSVDYDKTS